MIKLTINEDVKYIEDNELLLDYLAYITRTSKMAKREDARIFFLKLLFDNNINNPLHTVYISVEMENQENTLSVDIENISPMKEFNKDKAYGGGSTIYEVFPEDWKELAIRFSEFHEMISKTEECIDAYRIGLCKDKESIKEYESYISCCGRRDEKYIINDKEYIFGCNFGH